MNTDTLIVVIAAVLAVVALLAWLDGASKGKW